MKPNSPSFNNLIIGLFPWCWMGIIQILAMTCLYLDLGINPLIFPISLILSFAGLVWVNKLYAIEHRQTMIPILVIMTIGLGIVRFVFDVTFDGQDYHQEAILKLISGWSPVSPQSFFSIHHHYPIGSWVISASIASFTKMIETGKLFQLILIISSYHLVYFSLGFITDLKRWMRIGLSIVLAFNPISLYQTLSHYVDGMLAACYLLVVLGGVILFFAPDGKKYAYPAYLMIILSIIIGFSLKFTAVPILGVLVIGTGVLLLVNQKHSQLKFLFIVSSLGGIVAVAMVSFHPYMTNTLRHQDPFYPFNDPEQQKRIIRTQLPDELLDKNRLEKLALSTFCQAENQPNEPLRVKVPFTFNPEKLRFFKGPDTRISGWGPMFSGLLVLSLIGWFWLLMDKKRRPFALQIGLFIAFILASVIIIPEAWNARYVPQYYFIPAIIMLAMYQKREWFAKIILIVMMINMLIIGGNYITHNYMMTLRVYATIRTIKADQALVVIPRFHKHAQSVERRLIEYDIPYEMGKMGKAKDCEQTSKFRGNSDNFCLIYPNKENSP